MLTSSGYFVQQNMQQLGDEEEVSLRSTLQAAILTNAVEGYIFDLNDFHHPTVWRTNLLSYTEDFDFTVWTKTGITVLPYAIMGPDGRMSGALVSDDNSTGAHLFRQFSVTLADGSYWRKIRVKKNTARYVWMGTAATATTSSNTWIFDLDTNTWAFTGTGHTSISAVDLGDGWWELGLEHPAVSGSTSLLTCGLASGPLRADAGSYTGATSLSAYFWGAQYSASFSTPYQRIREFGMDYLAAFPNTSLFADSGGSAHADLHGPVGLQLDYSKGLELGPELSNPAGWVAITTSSMAPDGVSWILSGGGGFRQFQTLTAGKRYRVIFDILEDLNPGATVAEMRFGTSGGTSYTGPLIKALGRYTYFIDGGGAADFRFTSRSATTHLRVGNVSVREVYGHSRYQTTATSRPVLRGTPTGLTKVVNGHFDTDLSSWIISNSAVWSSGSARVSYSGGVQSAIAQAIVSADTMVRVRWKQTIIAGTRCRIRFRNLTNTADVTGAIYVVGSKTHEIFCATSAGGILLQFLADDVDGIVDFDDIEVVDCGPANSAAPYYLTYDGADDFLISSPFNLTGTDAISVCRAMFKFSDAATTLVEELSPAATSNNGIYYFASPNTNNVASISVGSKGTTIAAATYTDASVGVLQKFMATMTADISAPRVKLRINRVERASSTATQGTGNYGTHQIYYGRRGGTGVVYSGYEYSSCMLGLEATGDLLTLMEDFTQDAAAMGI